jgi:transposase
MAKLTDSEKKLLVADHHTGKYSQRQLAKKYNVSLGTVSKITKEIKPENEHLVNAQTSILWARAILPPEQMNAIVNAAQDELYNKGLVTNATQINIARTMEYLYNNKKLEKISVGQGIQELVEVGLASDDFKQCQDAIDKASITLGVNPRHAPKNEINNTNAQQTVSEIVIRDA